MTSAGKAKTLGELKKSDYKVVGIREELRRNLIKKIVAEEGMQVGSGDSLVLFESS